MMIDAQPCPSEKHRNVWRQVARATKFDIQDAARGLWDCDIDFDLCIKLNWGFMQIDIYQTLIEGAFDEDSTRSFD